jgi:ATP-binding cassette subfamily B (MDR/TAP) protein 1
LIRGQNATPFQVFQVIEGVNMAAFSIIAAATYFPEYIRARVSAGLMFKMLEETPQIDSSAVGGLKNVSFPSHNIKWLQPINGNISLKDVHFSYPNNGQKVMNGLSVEATNGQTLALVCSMC